MYSNFSKFSHPKSKSKTGKISHKNHFRTLESNQRHITNLKKMLIQEKLLYLSKNSKVSSILAWWYSQSHTPQFCGITALRSWPDLGALQKSCMPKSNKNCCNPGRPTASLPQAVILAGARKSSARNLKEKSRDWDNHRSLWKAPISSWGCGKSHIYSRKTGESSVIYSSLADLETLVSGKI